jgi:uncharacterized protein YjbI with pentapeptide repeats
MHYAWLEQIGGVRDFQHKAPYASWQSSGPAAKPVPANLCDTNLIGRNLSFVTLRNADLSGTYFWNANLINANLTGANLRNADLRNALLKSATVAFADLTGANLQGADLSGAYATDSQLVGSAMKGVNLSDADLSRANFSGADLYGAHLNGTRLKAADLKGSRLRTANLTGADLEGANVSSADLRGATLTKANFLGADLTGVDLTGADLTGANLRDAKVTQAKFFGANLTDVIYAPDSDPPDADVAGILGLSTLQIPSNLSVGVVQLQKLLRDGGLRDAERAATYSIERSVTSDRFLSPYWTFAWVEGIGRFAGFDSTTAYGLHPAYALGWIFLLGALLTPVYMAAMLHPTLTSGIVQIFPADRLDGTAGDPTIEREREKQVVRATSLREAFWSASYFSLISALNIGFEQFTPGEWIRRLQGRDYSLEAVGWVRVIAGAQALLSVFLLAMWVLTQFGRPFE